MAWGCATAHDDSLTADTQGVTEIRIDATPLRAFNITHVTVEAPAAGMQQVLVSNPATGTFDGTLLLPAGPEDLVARAFSDQTLVAESHPTSIVVTAGVVTRVSLRLLDTTPDAAPLFGPIVDSLSYPTTTQAGALATLAISVVAPAGDPVAYAWSSDCQDSTFSAAQAATTSWSKAAPGACTIQVTATSNGFVATESFVIVVFPSGSGSGGVTVSGTLVTRPTLNFSLPNLGCFTSVDGNASPGGSVSCRANTLASPSATQFDVTVFNWGGSSPGGLELSDNCGGRFGAAFGGPDSQSGSWLPPANGGLCILTARAVSTDDLAGTLSIAVLTRPGSPATAQPPQLSMQFNSCGFGSGGPGSPVDCGQIPAGAPVFSFGFVSWVDGLPGSLTVADDCGGGFTPTNIGFGNFSNSWTVLGAPGTTCTMTVTATNLQGITSVATAQYHLR